VARRPSLLSPCKRVYQVLGGGAVEIAIVDDLPGIIESAFVAKTVLPIVYTLASSTRRKVSAGRA
jgi:hypothetical protein